MKASIVRRPDGSPVLHVDTEENPEAQVLYDLVRDTKPRPKFLVEGAEQARNPEHITADNPPFYEGDETVAQVTPDGVYIEHIWSGDKMLLSHEDFIDFVETYMRLLELRRQEAEARPDASGKAE